MHWGMVRANSAEMTRPLEEIQMFFALTITKKTKTLH
jgi:hypothetical protein